MAGVIGTQLTYSKEKPTSPGWYWARNQGDAAGEVWEAIVRVEKVKSVSDGLTVEHLCSCWLCAFGECDGMLDTDWSEDCEWAGPIEYPINSSAFRGRKVDSDGK